MPSSALPFQFHILGTWYRIGNNSLWWSLHQCDPKGGVCEDHSEQYTGKWDILQSYGPHRHVWVKVTRLQVHIRWAIWDRALVSESGCILSVLWETESCLQVPRLIQYYIWFQINLPLYVIGRFTCFSDSFFLSSLKSSSHNAKKT